MERGANGAIVVTEAIQRLLETPIFPKDIVLLTEDSLRNAQRKLQEARINLGKPKGYRLTLREFCMGCKDYKDPIELAYRLIILRRRGA